MKPLYRLLDGAGLVLQIFATAAWVLASSCAGRKL